MSILDEIADESLYPQASSFDPLTMVPGPLLKARQDSYEKHLKWSSWNPGSLIDVGAGKGFHLNFWSSVQRVVAVESLERCVGYIRYVRPDAQIYESFCKMLAVPADLMLFLRSAHGVFWEMYSFRWLVKAAILCKKDMVIETSFDRTNSTIGNMLKHKELELPFSFKTLGIRYEESEFLKFADKFFILRTRFPSTYAGYEVFHYTRKLPPVEVIPNQVIPTYLDLKTNTWVKTKREEHEVLMYITAIQLFGMEDSIISILVNEHGTIVGIRQKNIGGDKSSVDECYRLTFELCKFFVPVGYMVWDIVPINVIGGIPIDTGLAFPYIGSFNINDMKSDAMRRFNYFRFHDMMAGK